MSDSRSRKLETIDPRQTMVAALWILAAVFLALTSLSLIDGMNAVRVTRITGPIQLAIVGAFLVILTALCRRLAEKTQRPRFDVGLFARRNRPRDRRS